jgi:hypothetical protein
MITSLIAGTPLELDNHSVAGNGERDGLKMSRLGNQQPSIY